MGQNSKIEWTDHTFNPWWGCVKLSPGCANCYAEKQANRFGDWWGQSAERRFFGDKHWNDPRRWDRKAERNGVPAKVFCGSMCDYLEDRRDLDAPRQRLYSLIYNTPNLIWLMLTKRPQNRHLIPMVWPTNAWYGVSISTQDDADRLIPVLLQTPAAVRFVSVEPMLEEIYLSNEYDNYLEGWSTRMACYGGPVIEERFDTPGIDQVIIGGESGPGARPMHPDWARSTRDQCINAGVPYFLKQWGEWFPRDQWEHNPGLILPDDCECDSNMGTYRWPDGSYSHRVGKKAAGRLLDGREWNQFPQLSSAGQT